MITILAIVLIMILPYFAPAIVAFARGHHQKWAILVLDVLLGWTFIGWVGALVWSLTRVDDGLTGRSLRDTFR